MMSQEQYAEESGARCPFCESNELRFSRERPKVHFGDVATQRVSCVGCKEVWYDKYKLVGYVLEEKDAIKEG